MKISIFIIFSVIILLKISSISNTATEESKTNYELFGDELPKRIKFWKSKEYGLEMSEIEKSGGLSAVDFSIQWLTNKRAPSIMQSRVNDEIEKRRKDSLPDFTITKLDPISYEFEKEKMFIIFTNMKLKNLDTYDKKNAKFAMNGRNITGKYNLSETMYNAISSGKPVEQVKKENEETSKLSYTANALFEKLKKFKEEGLDKFKQRIHSLKDGNGNSIQNKYFLERTDVEWTIEVSANFVPEATNGGFRSALFGRGGGAEGPIIIDTEFQIQPSNLSNEKALRAKGTVRIEFYDFKFDISVVVTHTDNTLRKYFPVKKHAENLVPELKVDYGMKSINIPKEDIKLLPYDGDVHIPEIPDLEEDVNPEGEINLKQETQNETTPTTSKESEKEHKSIDDEELKKEMLKKDTVIKHFEELKYQVKNNPGTFKKKMYLNLMPKMAWKIMQMDSKATLPNLLLEMIQYNDTFQERTKVPEVNPFTLI